MKRQYYVNIYVYQPNTPNQKTSLGIEHFDRGWAVKAAEGWVNLPNWQLSCRVKVTLK